MKPLYDKELDESLRSLDQSIRLKPSYEDQLRRKVMYSQHRRAKGLNKKLVAVAASVILFVSLGTSPLYSPTIAALAAKFIPLEIKKGHPSRPESVMDGIRQIISEAGYEASSLGISADYTIELSLMKNSDSLAVMKKVLEPEIVSLLDEKGIDQYELKFKLFKPSFSVPDEQTLAIQNVIVPIVDAGFKKYGYEEFSDKSGYGFRTLKDGSVQVDLNMPDHIKEADSIKTYVLEHLKFENINVSKVKIDYYNVERELVEGRWRLIADNIYSALAGKSLYNVVGYSYTVKDGKAIVNMKTSFNEKPSETVLNEIIEAVNVYLHSEEMKEEIKEDQYEINFLSKDKKILFDITIE